MSDTLAEAVRELVRAEVRAELARQREAPPRLLSVAEAARAAGLSRAMFYRAVLTPGAVRVHRVGRRVLISERELAAWMAQGESA